MTRVTIPAQPAGDDQRARSRITRHRRRWRTGVITVGDAVTGSGSFTARLYATELAEPATPVTVPVGMPIVTAALAVTVFDANGFAIDPGVTLSGGDQVAVRYTLTSTGTWDLADTGLLSDLFGQVDSSCWGDASGVLPAGHSIVCDLRWTISQDQVSAGAATFWGTSLVGRAGSTARSAGDGVRLACLTRVKGPIGHHPRVV